MKLNLQIAPYVQKSYTFTLRCPCCKKAAPFRVVRHGTRLEVSGFPAATLHRHYDAVCSLCGRHYRLEAGDVSLLLTKRRQAYRERYFLTLPRRGG
ncbi:MAG: hypothetical protein ACOYKJ_07680 [Candidatus Howiella sp.]|jgi:hypothetical protein